MRLTRAEPKNRPVKIAGPNLLVSKLAEHCNMNCIGSVVVVFFIRHLIIRVIYIYVYMSRSFAAYRVQVPRNVWQHPLGVNGLGHNGLLKMIRRLWILYVKKRIDRKRA